MVLNRQLLADDAATSFSTNIRNVLTNKLLPTSKDFDLSVLDE